jgi:hypothetical protein
MTRIVRAISSFFIADFLIESLIVSFDNGKRIETAAPSKAAIRTSNENILLWREKSKVILRMKPEIGSINSGLSLL